MLRPDDHVLRVAGDQGFDDGVDPSLLGTFDGVVIDRTDASNLEPAETIRRAANWCRPGGRVFVADTVDTFAARKRGLDTSAGTSPGDACRQAHTFADYARWLERAGFSDVDLTTTELVELSIISATLDNKGDKR